MSAPATVRPQQHHSQYHSSSAPSQTSGQQQQQQQHNHHSSATNSLMQRISSTRNPQHTRQTSVTRTASQRDPHAGDMSAVPRRDHEYSQRTAGNTRSDHSRQPSNMSEMAANGTGAADDASRHGHHSSQRPRKTTINGVTGTWVLGKTIGAGSMGKVKIARKLDGSEQVSFSFYTNHNERQRVNVIFASTGGLCDLVARET